MEPQLRIVLRPLASGLPLGFFAFGLGMAILGAEGVGWSTGSDLKVCGLLLAAYVFPLEATAMVFAFLSRDTIGAVALGLFTTSWLAIGVVTMQATPGSTSDALGIFSIWFSATVLLIAIAGITAKPFISTVMFVAVARSALFGVYELTGNVGWERAGGWLGWAIAVLALYGGLAFALEDARGETVLPTFRRGSAQVIDESLDGQVERIENEAGVRRQL